MSKQLGINPKMDKLALDNGLGHWSCTDPFYAQTWCRSDGFVKSVDDAKPFDKSDRHWDKFAIKRLKLADKYNPIGKDWQQPSELPEKVIVSSGCHDCPFDNDGFYCRLNGDIYIEQFIDHEARNNECPLLTHTIKVVKND